MRIDCMAPETIRRDKYWVPDVYDDRIYGLSCTVDSRTATLASADSAYVQVTRTTPASAALASGGGVSMRPKETMTLHQHKFPPANLRHGSMQLFSRLLVVLFVINHRSTLIFLSE
jgi:hypothetical protein